MFRLKTATNPILRLILHIIAFLLLILTACTPQEPETAATIVVQRPTFTPSPLQPTNTPTFTSIPSETPTPLPSNTPTPIPSNTPFHTSIPIPSPTASSTPIPTPGFDYSQLPECAPPTDPDELRRWEPCYLERLPDERWAILHYGRVGCGSQNRRLINLIDNSASELGWGRFIQSLPNGKMLFGLSYCEAGSINLFDPDTGGMGHLGPWGDIIWNTNQTAFAVESNQYYESTIWGYNVETESVFLPVHEGELDRQARWEPNGRYLFYQHSSKTWTNGMAFGPSEIYRADTVTGEKVVLVSDPQYSYHLCTSWDGDCEWHGSWIQIRQFPYQLEESIIEPDYSGPLLMCVLFGTECTAEVQYQWLNWQTGELVISDLPPTPASP
jgi:hypothetical protein